MAGFSTGFAEEEEVVVVGLAPGFAGDVADEGVLTVERAAEVVVVVVFEGDTAEGLEEDAEEEEEVEEGVVLAEVVAGLVGVVDVLVAAEVVVVVVLAALDVVVRAVVVGFAGGVCRLAIVSRQKTDEDEEG